MCDDKKRGSDNLPKLRDILEGEWSRQPSEIRTDGPSCKVLRHAFGTLCLDQIIRSHK